MEFLPRRASDGGSAGGQIRRDAQDGAYVRGNVADDIPLGLDVRSGGNQEVCSSSK